MNHLLQQVSDSRQMALYAFCALGVLCSFSGVTSQSSCPLNSMTDGELGRVECGRRRMVDVGKKCEFTCDADHVHESLQTVDFVICGSSGDFLPDPTCIPEATAPKCDADTITGLMNGEIDCGDDGFAKEDEHCTVDCDPGFLPSTKFVKCVADTATPPSFDFDELSPTCTAAICTIPEIANGEIECSHSAGAGDEDLCNVICVAGYAPDIPCVVCDGGNTAFFPDPANICKASCSAFEECQNGGEQVPIGDAPEGETGPFYCQNCDHGFTGVCCDEPTCTDSCKNGGTVDEDLGGGQVTCTCLEDFTGACCEDTTVPSCDEMDAPFEKVCCTTTDSADAKCFDIDNSDCQAAIANCHPSLGYCMKRCTKNFHGGLIVTEVAKGSQNCDNCKYALNSPSCPANERRRRRNSRMSEESQIQSIDASEMAQDAMDADANVNVMG